MKKEAYDTKVIFEPLIKSLPYIIQDLEINPIFYGSIIVPTSNLAPKILKDNSFSHKSPRDYLAEGYNLENNYPLCLITKTDTLEFRLFEGKVLSVKDLSILDFSKYLFDEKKFSNSNKNQVLEIAQIFLSTEDIKLNNDIVSFLFSELYRYTYPYYEVSDIDEMIYKGKTQVSRDRIYSHLISKDEEHKKMEKRLRMLNGEGSRINLIDVILGM